MLAACSPPFPRARSTGKVSAVSIPVFRPYYDEREEQAVVEVLRSGWIGLGPRTEEFEERFARKVGARYAVALNSATAALHIALRLVDVGPGDEVLVPTLTFVSSAMIANYENAVPVFCDIRADTLALDVEDAAGRKTLQTRAVVPVLYGGKPIPDVDLGVPAIYDCAHATGASWDPAGKLCCWSFHAVKNLATGDGGMITTDDEELYRRAVRLRWLGIDKSTWERAGAEQRYWWEYKIDEVGYKYHLNDIAAALGLVQLEKLDEMQEIRHRLVRQYLEELADVPEIELPSYDPDSSWHLLTIRVRHRNELSLWLQEQGISTGVHYKPVHLYPLYHKYALPVAEREWERLLTLPLFPALTSDQVSHISAKIREGLALVATA
jgi:perosamine synthetase